MSTLRSNLILLVAIIASLFMLFILTSQSQSMSTLMSSDSIPNEKEAEPPCPVCPSPSIVEVIVKEPTVDTSVDMSGPNAEILPMFRHAAITSDSVVSKLANHMDFDTEWFRNQHKDLFLGSEIVYHRKVWELTYIAHVVKKLNLCQEGKVGLVWAAGTERLISYFAGKGCAIMASDMNAEGAIEKGWATTNQHAASKDALFHEAYLTKEKFDRLVSYRTQDMNHVPVDTRNSYDFTWSTCSMEHVGSIPLGQRFVMNTMDLLKPGGVAIHTVEFTISSDSRTLTSGNTVLWRKQDVDYLVLSLQVLGYEVYPVDFGAGEGLLDTTPDLPPFKAHDHIKLLLAEHVVTSFAIVVRKPETWKSGLVLEQTECTKNNNTIL